MRHSRGPVVVPAPGAPALRGGVDAAVDDSPFAVVPTPPEGSRRSDVQVWDESTRPVGPDPDPNRRYTAPQQANGRSLPERWTLVSPVPTSTP